jgi:hypothetical protein
VKLENIVGAGLFHTGLAIFRTKLFYLRMLGFGFFENGVSGLSSVNDRRLSAHGLDFMSVSAGRCRIANSPQAKSDRRGRESPRYR